MWERVLQSDRTPGPGVWENVLRSSKEQKAIRVTWTETLKMERGGQSLGCEGTGGTVNWDLLLRAMEILNDCRQSNNMIRITILVALLVIVVHVFSYVSSSKLLCFSKSHVWGAGNIPSWWVWREWGREGIQRSWCMVSCKAVSQNMFILSLLPSPWLTSSVEILPKKTQLSTWKSQWQPVI